MADTMQASNPGSLLDTLQYWDTQLSSTAAGYFTRLYAGFYTISIVASLWVYFVARRLPPGLARALVCLPVVVLQLAATPVLVDRTRTAVLIVPVCGILSLAAFKVAAFAIGRGPLAMSQFSWTQNLLQFGVVLSLPVIPKDAFKLGAGASLSDLGSQAPATWGTFLKLYGYKAGGATIAASLAIWPVLPELVRHWFYALCLSLTLGAMWDFWCCVAVVTAGIPVAPSFDKPWLSTSFADYWSRRWNLTTSYLLRVLVYEPVREGRFVPAAVAVTSTNSALASKTTAQPRSKAPAAAAAAAPAGPEDDPADDVTAPLLTNLTDCEADPSWETVDKVMTKGQLVKQADSATAPLDTSNGKQTRPVAVDLTADSTAAGAATLQDLASSSSGSGSDGSVVGDSTYLSEADSTAVIAEPTSEPKADAVTAPTGAAAAVPRRKETPLQATLHRVAATHATFFFSGLWHMLIFYYATGLVTYHWLTFFTVQGPIMVAETLLKHYAKKAGFKLPYPVQVFLANFLLIVVARPLFFGPCDWSGLCTAMMDNVKSSVV